MNTNREKQVYYSNYKNIVIEINKMPPIEIINPYPRFTSYIYIPEEHKDFNKILKTFRKNKHLGSLDNIVKMQNGITFQQIEAIEDYLGKRRYFKIGNDYQHIWNDRVYSLEEIETDLKETIDNLTN